MATGALVTAGAYAVRGPRVVRAARARRAVDPCEYLRTLANQGSEDFTGVVMLWTTPTPRQLVAALMATFLTPWPFPATAAAVFLLGGFGARRCCFGSTAPGC